MNFFNEHMYFLLLLAAFLGLLVGSFLNVVIYRLPLMLETMWRKHSMEFLGLSQPEEKNGFPETFNIAFPRSRCPHCKNTIAAWDNIPLISFIILRGKCRVCYQRISLLYPFVEVLTACVTVFLTMYFGLGWVLMGALIFSWGMIVLAFIDFKHQILPDQITLSLLWIGLLCNIFGFYTDVISAIVGAIAGYVSLWSIAFLFKTITGKEGMGYGDFKLLAMIGAWIGWQLLPLVILLSSFVGALVGITLILSKKQHRDIPIPFGPYLAVAGWIGLVYGQTIMQWYL